MNDNELVLLIRLAESRSRHVNNLNIFGTMLLIIGFATALFSMIEPLSILFLLITGPPLLYYMTTASRRFKLTQRLIEQKYGIVDEKKIKELLK